MEKINIAKLLKDCPSGMELDCTMYENCTFDLTEFDSLTELSYPIKVQTPDGRISLNKYGCYSNNEHSKCIIFPKGKTTWEGFVPPCKFKDGDIVTCTNDDCTYTAIFKEMIDKGAFCHYVILVDNKFRCVSNDWSDFNETCRLATEEEKQKLFDAIKANGYKWNAETKTLEKLIEPKFKVGDRIKKAKDYISGIITNISDDGSYKVEYQGGGISYVYPAYQDEWELVPNKFDITTLKPFESRVLVRGADSDLWKPAIYGFSHPKGCYVVGGVYWKQFIPYEGNEHLLGKTDDCDEYFKNWE